jgi:hypothetical protein
MSTELEPAQRAAVLKLSLATVADHPRRAELEAALQAGPAAGLVERITDARPSEWLPIEINMAVMTALHQVLGDHEFVDFYLRQMHRAETDSVFGRFIAGATRLITRTPAARLGNLPRGMDLAQRDCGAMVVSDRRIDGAKVEIRGIPGPLRNHIYAKSMEAPLHYAVSTTGATAKVECDAGRLGAGILRFEVRWAAPEDTPTRER